MNRRVVTIISPRIAAAITLLTLLVLATPALAQPAITKIMLINANSDQPIEDPIEDGATFNLAELPTENLAIEAVGNGETMSVSMRMRGAESFDKTENGVPYAMHGDSSGDFEPWVPTGGEYTVEVDPFPMSDQMGTAGQTFSITFTINTQMMNNQAPTVSFASPNNNATVEQGQDVEVAIDANDPDGDVQDVRLRLDGQERAVMQEGGQWTATLSGLGAGNYTLQATATDDGGAEGSAELSFTVGGEPMADMGQDMGDPTTDMGNTSQDMGQTGTTGDMNTRVPGWRHQRDAGYCYAEDDCPESDGCSTSPSLPANANATLALLLSALLGLRRRKRTGHLA